MTSPAGKWPACYDHVFKALEGVTDRNGRWDAHCPAHWDEKKSLSVGIGATGKLVMRCHAPCQCPVPAILAKLKLKLDDLFPDNAHYKKARREMATERTHVKNYDYRDENGKLLLRVQRWSPKGFSQCRPNPAYDPSAAKSKDNAEFIYNAQGVRLVPYRLPEIIAVRNKNPNKWMFVLEGEKSVDLAWAHNMLATCNPMGALKWDKVDPASLEIFRGANVVVISDDDPVDPATGFSPGIRHAEQFCELVKGIVNTVRHLRLSDRGQKEDFDVWWESKSALTPTDRLKELRALVEKTPVWGQPGSVATPPATSPPSATSPPVSSAASPPATSPPTFQAPNLAAAPADGEALVKMLRRYQEQVQQEYLPYLIPASLDIVAYITGRADKMGYVTDMTKWGEHPIAWAQGCVVEWRKAVAESKAQLDKDFADRALRNAEIARETMDRLKGATEGTNAAKPKEHPPAQTQGEKKEAAESVLNATNIILKIFNDLPPAAVPRSKVEWLGMISREWACLQAAIGADDSDDSEAWQEAAMRAFRIAAYTAKTVALAVPPTGTKE